MSKIVEEVIDGREGVYGDPVTTFPRVAQIWSGILGHEVTAEQAVLMLIGYKTLRASMTPDYSDNSDDIEGYLDIFRKVVGADMVHARSVDEYLEKKDAPRVIQRGGLTDRQQEQLWHQGLLQVDEPTVVHHMRESERLEPGSGIWTCTGCGWSGRGDRVSARELFIRDHDIELA